MLFRPLAELCITAAVCNIIDAKEARDISKSGHPDMVMLTQLDEGSPMPVAPPHAPNAPHAPATPPPMAPPASAAAVERAVADADPAALVALFPACAIGARTPVASGIASLADAPTAPSVIWRVDESTDPMRGALAAAGALPPLVAMLGDGTAEEQAAAAEALGKLAHNKANKAAMAAAGAVEALVALERDGDAQGVCGA